MLEVPTVEGELAHIVAPKDIVQAVAPWQHARFRFPRSWRSSATSASATATAKAGSPPLLPCDGLRQALQHVRCSQSHPPSACAFAPHAPPKSRPARITDTEPGGIPVRTSSAAWRRPNARQTAFSALSKARGGSGRPWPGMTRHLKAFTDLRTRDIRHAPGGKTDKHYSNGKTALCGWTFVGPAPR
jgi:hypothetical protein